MKPNKDVIYSRSTVMLLVAFMVPMIWVYVFFSAWMHSQPFGRAIVFASFAALGWLACEAIYGLICGRFSMVLPVITVVNTANLGSHTDKTKPLFDTIILLIKMQFCFALIFALLATFLRMFLRSKSASSDSPLADAEIDARPMA